MVVLDGNFSGSHTYRESCTMPPMELPQRSGNAWVNGFALGRYWSRGPQRSLYVPAPVLRAGTNEVVVLELHAAHRSRTVDFVDAADLGPTEE